VLEDTHCYVKKADYTGWDGTSLNYTIDPTILETVELYSTSAGTPYRLERISDIEMIERRRLGQPSGTPAQVYAPLWCQPAHVLARPRNGRHGDYLQRTDPDGAGEPDGRPFQHDVRRRPFDPARGDLLSTRAARRPATTTTSRRRRGRRYSDWYDKEIKRYRDIIRKRGGDRNARAVVNDKRRRRLYHDNSIYPNNSSTY